MTRKVCITAADGHTGFAIAELLLTNNDFSKHVNSVTALSLNPDAPHCKELKGMGAIVVPHKPGRMKEMVNTLKKIGADAICLIPPTHAEKFDITVELIEAAKRANVPNVLFMSSAGSDLAEKDKQPRLREFAELEAMVLAAKGDVSTSTGHSPVVIRAGFYAENLLLYSLQAQEEGVLPLPVGKTNKFAPVALGDVAQLAAYVLSGHGKHGFSDKHRGQLMVLTGPMLASGEELAAAASQALGKEMQFEDISQAEAKKVLRAQSESDPSELEYLLEYYSLVREGKTNYISTMGFHEVTGMHPMQPVEFFKAYAESFQPPQQDGKAHDSKRRKVASHKKE